MAEREKGNSETGGGKGFFCGKRKENDPRGSLPRGLSRGDWVSRLPSEPYMVRLGLLQDSSHPRTPVHVSKERKTNFGKKQRHEAHI